MNPIEAIKKYLFEQDKEEEKESVRSVGLPGAVILCRPEDHEVVRHMADLLKQGNTLVVDLSSLPGEQRQRFIDFLSGVLMAVEGNIRMLDRDKAVCTPKEVDLKEYR